MAHLNLFWIELTPTDGGILERLPQAFSMPAGSTVVDALKQLFPQENPSGLIEARAVSVHGQAAHQDTVLHEGDRLEVLDALRFDPKESRRRRAQHRRVGKQS